MRIYTKTGDKGKTSLYDNTRVDKDSIRVDCYGTIDELNCSLGFAKNFIDNNEIVQEVNKIQRMLFNVAGELATIDSSKFPQSIKEEDVQDLEKLIDNFIARSNNTPQFILPGSSKASGALHMARTICRRAERRIITLSKEESVSPILMKYVNRLSDAIYAMARFLEDEVVLVEFDKKS
ncbi:MAG: cob(I)yrinic acid a,c-diamide adenosyltransferase [Lutispora sp.]|uniref:cob(I)yrinic acid a,c-diamide adenosyltransferase n=1 Tax=Lutispora sp. TaxID=2828727 RepID=UPI00356ACF0A